MNEKEVEEIPIRDTACCIACNYCRDGCPTAKQIGVPVPQQIPSIRVLNALHSRRIVGPGTPDLLSLSQDLLSNLYLCIGCGYCREVCPNQIDFPSQVESSKYYLIKKGLKPSQRLQDILTNIAKMNNPYGRPRRERVQWLKEIKSETSEDAKTVLFLGCTTSYLRNEIAISAIEILLKAEKEFRLLGKDEPCCGAILRMIGYLDKAEELANKNVTLLRDVDEVIFTCAACFKAFKIDYPRMGIELPFKPVHLIEVLDELIKDEKIKPGSVKMNITYHDPCNLGRYARVFDAPRKVLNSIDGLSLVEMYPAKAESQCCGGEHLRSLYSKHSLDIALDKIRLAKKVGATAIVSACPLCSTNFKDALKTLRGRAKLKEEFGNALMEVYDVAEIVRKSLKDPSKRE